jgi:glyoxylase-like metal-dependent hydrolase (beta-lactamase superfamily II)
MSLAFPFPEPPPPGTTLEVATGVHWLRMPLPFALDHINLWLLEDGDGFTLVDTGYGDATTRAIWEAHRSGMLRDRPIRRIVATHYHPDHLGNADWLAQRYGLQVVMTAPEYLTGHAIHAQTSGYALDDTCGLFRAHGVADEHVQSLRDRGNRYRAGVPEMPMRFTRLFPGSTLAIDDEAWRVIAGYGHSPEHAALHCPARGVMVSGDMLLPRISTNVAVWPAEPDADPLARFLDSIGAFESLPGDTLVLPSHGLPFRGIARRVAQLREHHRERLRELADAVRASGDGCTAADIVPVLFRRPLDVQQRFFAVGEAIAHLNYLAVRGALTRRVRDDGVVRFAAGA